MWRPRGLPAPAPPRPPGVLQTYLAAAFVAPFLATLAFFLFFLLSGQLFKLMRIIASGDAGVGVVPGLALHMAVTFLPLAAPLSVLFAALFCLDRLSQHSEVVAMRSFGLSKGGLLAPLLAMGALIAASVFLLGDRIVPRSKTLFRNAVIRLTAGGSLASIKPRSFFTDVPGVVLFAEEVDGRSDVLRGVFIRQEDPDGGESIISAREGRVVRLGTSASRTPSLRLRLRDGNVMRRDGRWGDLEKAVFRSYDVPIVRGGDPVGFVTKDSMLANDELARQIGARKEELAGLEGGGGPPEGDRRRILELRSQLSRSQVEYWGRFNTPLLCLVFAVLGLSLGIRKSRGKGRNTTMLAIAFAAGYYALFFGGVSMSRKGFPPAWAAVFLPTLLMGLEAARRYRRIDWQA